MKIYIHIIWLVLIILAGINVKGGEDIFLPFKWSGHQFSWGYNSKAALYIPVKFEGCEKQFYMQFDTGCQSTFIYGNVIKTFFDDIEENKPVIEMYWFQTDSGMCSNSIPIWWQDDDSVDYNLLDTSFVKAGIIGSDSLLNKILIIDYPNERFALCSKYDEIPITISDKVKYCPGEVFYNQFYISLIICGDTLHRVLFDTGASQFSLLLPKPEWKKYTGLDFNDPKVSVDSINSWGNDIEVFRANSQCELEFEDIRIKESILECVSWPTERSPDFRLTGNALVYDKYLIVVDFKNSRFGLALSE